MHQSIDLSPTTDNATKTGLTTVERPSSRNGIRFGLPSCRLAKQYKRVDLNADRMRRELEDAVAAARDGVVTILDASAIGTATDHERGRQYLATRLRRCEEAGTDVPLATAAAVVAAICKCSAGRDRCIRQLKLDCDEETINIPPGVIFAEPNVTESDREAVRA